MKHRRITSILKLSIVFMGFFLTMNIDYLTSETSISKTLNLSAGGDVWLSSVSTQTVGDIFETEIYVDTGSLKIGAYGFNIAYNKDVIQIGSDDNIEAGAEGFVSAVNIDNVNGLVTIVGIESMGTGPSSQLHLLTITWTAVDVGRSSLDLTIDTLLDTDYIEIGTPKDIDSSVVVEEGIARAPVLNSPSNIYYQESTIGHSITWRAIDDNPTTYKVTLNNYKQVAFGLWSSGVGITVNIDGLSEGYWVFNCTVFDGDGLSDSDTVNVRVTPINVGNVWFSEVSTQTVGDTFKTEIYVNTSNQNLAAYEFDITYNKSVIQIASEDDIMAGAEGFVSEVNIDNANGLVSITGFDDIGTDPSFQLHLLTITWTAVGEGTSSLDLSIDVLEDTITWPIGTPTDIDGSVEVEKASTFLYGDVNHDNDVDIGDALYIARYYVGLNPQPFYAEQADVNLDGEIDINDAYLVARYYIELIPSLPHP